MTNASLATREPQSPGNGRRPATPKDPSHDEEPGFAIVDNAVLDDYQLSPTQLAVYVSLCRFAYADVATVSIHHLQLKAHTSKATTCRAIHQLELKGLVQAERHDDAKGSHLATRYLLPLLSPHFHHERRGPRRPWLAEPPTPLPQRETPLSHSETSPPLSHGETSPPPLSHDETSPPLSHSETSPLSHGETSLVSAQGGPCLTVRQALSHGETSYKGIQDYSKNNKTDGQDCASGAAPAIPLDRWWDAVRDELAAIMTPDNFRAHIQNLHATPADDGSLTLLAPTSFDRDWLEHKLGRRLNQTFAYVARRAGVPDPQPPPLQYACT